MTRVKWEAKQLLETWWTVCLCLGDSPRKVDWTVVPKNSNDNDAPASDTANPRRATLEEFLVICFIKTTALTILKHTLKRLTIAVRPTLITILITHMVSTATIPASCRETWNYRRKSRLCSSFVVLSCLSTFVLRVTTLTVFWTLSAVKHSPVSFTCNTLHWNLKEREIFPLFV